MVLRFKLVVCNDFFESKKMRILLHRIASSHIPFVTGGLLYFIGKKCCFDGGFFSKPYLNMTPTFTVMLQYMNSSHTYTNFLKTTLQMNRLSSSL